MSEHSNLLGGIPPTLLPDDREVRDELAAGTDPSEVAARHPTGQLAWAVLAERGLAEGRTVQAYAYARTGYHRGLDALRRSGWRGQGPIPWEHEPNQGFLRALSALGRAAAAIGEDDEATRCQQFLRDSSPTAAVELSGPESQS
jgi:hypothetical protein